MKPISEAVRATGGPHTTGSRVVGVVQHLAVILAPSTLAQNVEHSAPQTWHRLDLPRYTHRCQPATSMYTSRPILSARSSNGVCPPRPLDATKDARSIQLPTASWPAPRATTAARACWRGPNGTAARAAAWGQVDSSCQAGGST